MKGFYLALEGVEGSGKSTISKALVAALTASGRPALAVREPGGTELGEQLRTMVLHSVDMAPWTEAALFAASRAQLVADVIAPALADGTWVVSDRSYYSSLAYQGGGRGLGVEAVRTLNETVLTGVLPDLVVVLDIPPSVGFARETQRDRMGAAGVALQQVVADTYREIASTDDRVVLIDGERTRAELADAVLGLALERYEHV